MSDQSAEHSPEQAPEQPSERALATVDRLIAGYCKKTGTQTHPIPEVLESVRLGLAAHLDQLKKPLCPCRFYPDKQEEVQHKTWICPCRDMAVYKYCHCLLFVNEDGLPITEYLPEDHEGRQVYGLVPDPTPDKLPPLRHRAAEREEERARRS